jgi:hypothetical protein
VVRTLGALLCVALVGGSVRADEGFSSPAARHDAAHEAGRELDGPAAQAKLRRMLAEIIEVQRRFRHDLDRITPAPHPTFRRDVQVLVAGPVVLKKGGSATGTHNIVWGAGYVKDTVDVKVTASDPSIAVPRVLNLDFEKHQFKFGYEIKAGDKAGKFTVTLKPEVGEAVEVVVVVE